MISRRYISAMFEAEGMKPTGVDRQAIEEGIATAEATAGELAERQRAMVAAANDDAAAAEVGPRGTCETYPPHPPHPPHLGPAFLCKYRNLSGGMLQDAW